MPVGTIRRWAGSTAWSHVTRWEMVRPSPTLTGRSVAPAGTAVGLMCSTPDGGNAAITAARCIRPGARHLYRARGTVWCWWITIFCLMRLPGGICCWSGNKKAPAWGLFYSDVNQAGCPASPGCPRPPSVSQGILRSTRNTTQWCRPLAGERTTPAPTIPANNDFLVSFCSLPLPPPARLPFSVVGVGL